MCNVFMLADGESTVYNFQRELIHRLITEGYFVTVAFPRGGSMTDEIIGIGCDFVDLKIDEKRKSPLTDLKLIGKIHSILKKYSPDIVLTFTMKPNLYGGFAANKLGIPHIGNITSLGAAGRNEGAMQKVVLQMYRTFMNKSSMIFFQNEGDMIHLQSKGIAQDKALLLPGSGVNLERFQPLPYPSNNIIRFSYIGRVGKEKGIEQFLEAAKAIKKIYYDIEFHIIGPCDKEYKGILDEYEKENVIIYHGPQNDIREFYRSSHCTIHVQFDAEEISDVLLETAASARPIIMIEKKGSGKIVEHEKTGYIISEKNSEALIERIEQFIILDFQSKIKMGLSGRIKAEKEFDRNIIVNIYLLEIERMMSSGRKITKIS